MNQASIVWDHVLCSAAPSGPEIGRHKNWAIMRSSYAAEVRVYGRGLCPGKHMQVHDERELRMADMPHIGQLDYGTNNGLVEWVGLYRRSYMGAGWGCLPWFTPVFGVHNSDDGQPP